MVCCAQVGNAAKLANAKTVQRVRLKMDFLSMEVSDL